MFNANKRFQDILNHTPEKDSATNMFEVLFKNLNPNMSDKQFVDLVTQCCPLFELTDNETEYHKAIFNQLSGLLKARQNYIDFGDERIRSAMIHPVSKIEATINDVMNESCERINSFIDNENAEMLKELEIAISNLLKEGKEKIEILKKASEGIKERTKKYYVCTEDLCIHSRLAFKEGTVYEVTDDTDLNMITFQSDLKEAKDHKPVNMEISRTTLRHHFEPTLQGK